MLSMAEGGWGRRAAHLEARREGVGRVGLPLDGGIALSCSSTADLLCHKYWGCLFFWGSQGLEEREPRVPSRKAGRRDISKLMA